MRGRIAAVLARHDVLVAAEVETPDEAVHLGAPSGIAIFACEIDLPREIAGLRRLCREMPSLKVVVITSPTTGTGARRALDAGASGLVFGPELELTLMATVEAVAAGQSVVPRELRAGVERPVLSHREREVLLLVGRGLTNREIAERLFLAESTVKSHLSSTFAKFGVRSRKEVAAAFADLEGSPATKGVGEGPAERITA